MSPTTRSMRNTKGLVASSVVLLLLLPLLLALIVTLWQPEQGLSLSTTTVSGTITEENQSTSPEERAIRRLMPDIDTEALERFKAEPSGYRRHPSYYSDKYIRRSSPEMSMDDKVALVTKWKAWTLVDEKKSTRPGNDFYNQFPSRDVPWAQLPNTAWQKDKDYLPKFLDEGLLLVERAMEAILTEYGFGSDRDSRPFEERIALLGLSEPRGKYLPEAGGYAVGNSFDGLVRRILHAIVTEDSFIFAMSGHSAAAGHGNHFQQSYTHAYGKFMEPIFARLGVFSASRNFGFGGLGTLQTGMATAALAGDDVDLLMWDSGMTEGGPAIAVLALQAFLGGSRIPFFLTDSQHGLPYLNILKEKVDADGGVFGSGESFTPLANTMNELQNMPYAARYLRCGPELQNTVCKGNRYRGMCWTDRTNFEFAGMNMSFVPPVPQQAEPGGRASWHPGDNAHQKTGRVLAGFVLHGIRNALLLWKNSTNLELKDEDWHVTTYYKNTREKITTSFREEAMELCNQTLVPPRLCQVPMQGRTEFTPRFNAASTSIRSIIKVTNSPIEPKAALYDPPEMYNPHLHPPPGSLDVLAIVEGGVDFASTLGHRRRRESLAPLHGTLRQEGSSVSPDIKPGKGWFLSGPYGQDMCDGEYDSWCKRLEDPGCLMNGHNDARNELIFDSLSGWLILELPNVREGLIIIEFHSWLYSNTNPSTDGWCNIDNDPPCTSRALQKEVDSVQENGNRQLKAPPPPYCDDFRFEFAIDGKITSWDRAQCTANIKQPQRVVEYLTLLDDPNYTGGVARNVELAFRMTGCGRSKVFGLTHVYWA